jgi:hypothetical protein
MKGIKIMITSSYDGLVQMKPNFENVEFFSGDDDFTYQMPRVYFECWGEINDSHSVFDWNDDSVITFKDNCAVKYTESTYCEFLMPDENGNENWFIGKYEWLGEEDLKYVREIRPVKSFMIEEFDWNRSEKRRYKVILEETSKLEEREESYLKGVINRDLKCCSDDYALTQY